MSVAVEPTQSAVNDASSTSKTNKVKEQSPKRPASVPPIPMNYSGRNEGGVDYFSKIKGNPFVPIGCLMTVGALALGLRAMVRGDRHQSQRMMRHRVGWQGFTVLFLCGGFAYEQWKDARQRQEKK